MWYEFTQNNTGGSFEVDDEVCHRLFIEADSEGAAEEKAFELGVYYDGVDEGGDCPCCGDRWYGCDEIKLPLDFGKEVFTTIEEYAQMMANQYGWTKPDGRIYYADGSVKEIFKPEL